MDTIRLITIAAIIATPGHLFAAQEEGVALAIVYDTSGSMKQPVRDRTDRPALFTFTDTWFDRDELRAPNS